jgi:hypothetical protein
VSLDEALDLLASNEGARLPPDRTLVNVMKARAASPDAVVDLGALEELRGSTSAATAASFPTASPSYRNRAVRWPSELRAEFGTFIPPKVELRVHDSNANMRYLVLPVRPEGTEDWAEEQLASIVTRDAMIGFTVPGADQPTRPD